MLVELNTVAKSRGYSLIELVVVITVIGILATITGVNYGDWQDTVTITQLKSDLTNIASAADSYRNFNNTYPVSIPSGIKVASSLTITGGSSDGKTYCYEATSSRASDITYYIDNVTAKSGAAPGNCASRPGALVAPTGPVVYLELSGANVRAAIGSVSCEEGMTTQYAIRSKLNNEDWSIYSSFSTVQTYTQPANDGVKYTYQAKSRCSDGLSQRVGTEAEGAANSYIDPISIPAVPTVAVNTVAATTRWSWSPVTCAIGIANYQYRYTMSPSGYDSGWVNNGAGLSVAFSTTTAGQTYTVNVQSKCIGAFIDSFYSASGSAVYVSTLKTVSLWSSASDDNGYSLKPTSDGGYIVAGYTAGYGGGGQDVLLAKYDSNDKLEWNTTWGGASTDVAYNVIQTSDGGYFVTGYTNSYGGGSSDILNLKYTSTGSLSWAKTWGGSGVDMGWASVQTSDGGYLTVGVSTGFVAVTDAVIIKYSSIGAIQWTRVTGNAGNQNYTDISRTSEGGYIVTGGGYANATYGTDAWLTKLDSAGTVSWTRMWGNTGVDGIVTTIQTADGGYFGVGNSAPNTSTQTEVLLEKFDSSGSLTWVRTWGGAAYDYAFTPVVASDGNYAIAGRSASVGAGDYDSLLLKYSSTGTFIWAKTFGSTLYDTGRGFFKDANGNYMMSGSVAGLGLGSGELFIAKYKADGSITGCSSPRCQSVTATAVTPSITEQTASYTILNSPSATMASPSATITNPSVSLTKLY